MAFENEELIGQKIRLMKVSLLIPVYGVEKYIEKCAVSLFEQTYEDIEYIFVDDCTPDNSMNVLSGVIERYPKRKRSHSYYSP